MELEFRRYPKLIFNYANSIRRKHVRQKLFFFMANCFFLNQKTNQTTTTDSKRDKLFSSIC